LDYLEKMEQGIQARPVFAKPAGSKKAFGEIK
jgi:hypothetical protein